MSNKILKICKNIYLEPNEDIQMHKIPGSWSAIEKKEA